MERLDQAYIDAHLACSLDMFDPFLFLQVPFLRFGRSVGHTPQYDPTDLEARISKSNCAGASERAKNLHH